MLQDNTPAFTERSGLTIKNLRTFFCLSRLKNFHTVARYLGVSQPAVTTRISQLEDALGCRLLSRASGQVTLTPEGINALRYCEKILENVDQLAIHFSDVSEIAGRVRIGVVDTIARALLPKLLTRLHVEFPRLDVEVTNESTIVLQDLLLSGEISICISINPVDGVDIQSNPLCHFDMEWVASPDLVDPGRVYTQAELFDLPLISYVRGSPPHKWLSRYLPENEADHAIRNATNSMSTMIWLAENGLGFAAIPPVAITQHLSSNRLMVIKSDIALDPIRFFMSARTRPFSSAVRAVEALVKKEVKAHLPAP